MIQQMQKIIDLFFIINKHSKKQSISILCLEKIKNRFEKMQYDIWVFSQVMDEKCTKNNWIAIQEGVLNLSSGLLTFTRLISVLLSKELFEIYENNQEIQNKAKKVAKKNIIKLLLRSFTLIKKEFERERFSKRRACEIQRGKKEIEELRIVLQQLDAYLDFIQNHMPSTQKEIRVFIDTIILFFNCIACHVGFLVWLADFWVNCRFLQLHDE